MSWFNIEGVTPVPLPTVIARRVPWWRPIPNLPWRCVRDKHGCWDDAGYPYGYPYGDPEALLECSVYYSARVSIHDPVWPWVDWGEVFVRISKVCWADMLDIGVWLHDIYPEFVDIYYWNGGRRDIPIPETWPDFDVQIPHCSEWSPQHYSGGYVRLRTV